MNAYQTQARGKETCAAKASSCR